MSFAQAFEKVAAKKGKNTDIPQQAKIVETDPERVPMMYRAQVSGRCSLMFAGDNQDLDDWTQEWIYSKSESDKQPQYQYKEPQQLGLDGLIYRIKIQFPFRLCSNCGQDSILRPVIGKNGIPFIPGSSVKGVFRRACNQQQANKYCGDDKELTPGILRFHGAYPVGDWAGTKEVNVRRDGRNILETRYRMVDVIHPQQERQVQGTGSPKALAMISLYRPKMIFELSSTQPLNQEEWEKIKGLLRVALRQGLGGKTSTGYGLPFIPKDRYSITVYLNGIGISPLLRSDEPEFRPNLFKATLRSHVRRLLAGVCSNKDDVERKANQLFGYTTAPGDVQIYWQPQKLNDDSPENNPIYNTKGLLHIDAKHKSDIDFLKRVLKFAYMMGGFGKSWRRVWHKQFYTTNPNYARLIGCHWKSDSDYIDIKTTEALTTFLDELYRFCGDYFGSKPIQSLSWKEAWSKERLTVYSKVVSQSQVIDLFHDPTFKSTPAIGGRNPSDDRPRFVSSVWHRMLPISDNQYLEIVTLFHGDRTLWMRQGEDQLHHFIRAIQQKFEEQNMKPTWGTDPTSQTTLSSSPQPHRR